MSGTTVCGKCFTLHAFDHSPRDCNIIASLKAELVRAKCDRDHAIDRCRVELRRLREVGSGE
jgi:hypothetical protein